MREPIKAVIYISSLPSAAIIPLLATHADGHVHTMYIGTPLGELCVCVLS